jgi:hypothetical protein
LAEFLPNIKVVKLVRRFIVSSVNSGTILLRIPIPPPTFPFIRSYLPYSAMYKSACAKTLLKPAKQTKKQYILSFTGFSEYGNNPCGCREQVE